MKTQIKALAALLIPAMMLTSCASIISGSKQSVAFSSEPSGAEIRIDGQPIGVTPVTAKVKRNALAVKFQKEGYADYEYFLKKKFNGWFIGNIFLGGFPGMLVDLITNAYMNIEDNVHKKMDKK